MDEHDGLRRIVAGIARDLGMQGRQAVGAAMHIADRVNAEPGPQGARRYRVLNHPARP
ncbi:hypothetical protein [Roseicella frigidaeris]|uniref:hypothetical protein n=1 Tax=Roseicella frigidaeris TaxID=2230885 RepID=UPI001FB2F5EB|nr:hypothetical protein [Roseicella frigidaeris]